jgi:hypothetical protein
VKIRVFMMACRRAQRRMNRALEAHLDAVALLADIAIAAQFCGTFCLARRSGIRRRHLPAIDQVAGAFGSDMDRFLFGRTDVRVIGQPFGVTFIRATQPSDESPRPHTSIGYQRW